MSRAVVDDPLATLAGQKHVAVLQKHLRHLRNAYAHGNRKLFYDELLTAYLLAFFNPTLRSLRAIEDFSSDADRHPRRLCRSTMSDANALMDARLRWSRSSVSCRRGCRNCGDRTDSWRGCWSRRR